MDSKAKEALARRAVACKGWRWMPGMLTLETWKEDALAVVGTVERGPVLVIECEDREWAETAISDDSLPDLGDPATLGCLLALVREAWGDPLGSSTPERRGQAWACVVGGRLFAAPTEAEVLVSALEAAPC